MRALNSLAVVGLVASLLMSTAVGCTADSTEEVSSTGSDALKAPVGDPSIAIEWDAKTFQVDPLPSVNRSLALVHIAQFDAVNAITKKYVPWGGIQPAVSSSASKEAAAVQAAYRVLLNRYGGGNSPSPTTAQQAVRDKIVPLRTAHLAAIADGQAKTDGIAVGDAVGGAVLGARATDNYSLPNPTTYSEVGSDPENGTDPDDYQLTPPGFVNPVNQLASQWKPFAMNTADQFRPEPPPAITDGKFTKDFNEVKEVGRACPDPNNCARTPEQTAIANFFIELSGPAMFRLARTVVGNEKFDLDTAVRFFAHLAIANADGVQSVFDAKYTYDFVRPITAIRNAAADGNPDTDAEAGWTPHLVTPNHPEYSAGHPCITNSMVQVFEKYFGQNYAFDATSTSSPVILHFGSFQQLADTVQDARIWGGIHYRNSVEVAGRQGRAVGKWVLASQLQPVE
jgi:hypothetical protein